MSILEGKKEELALEYVGLSNQVIALKAEVAKLTEDGIRIGKLNAENDALWRALEISKADVEKIKDELTELQSQKDYISGEVARLEGVKNGLLNNCDYYGKQTREIESKINLLNAEKEAVNKELSELGDKEFYLNETILKLEKHQIELSESISQKGKGLKDLEISIECARKNAKEEQKNVDFLCERRDALKNEIQSIERIKNESSTKFDLAERIIKTKIAEVEAVLKNREDAIKGKEKEITILEKAIKDLSEQQADKRRILTNRELDLEAKEKMLNRFKEKLEMSGAIRVPFTI